MRINVHKGQTSDKKKLTNLMQEEHFRRQLASGWHPSQRCSRLQNVGGEVPSLDRILGNLSPHPLFPF